MRQLCWTLRAPLLAAALALGCAAGALGQTASTASAPLARVSIAGLKGPTSIGMVRFMADQPVIDGTQTRFEVVTTPDLMIARILSGAVGVAFLPTNLAAVLYAKGVPVRLAATTGDGVIYIVTSRSDIHDVRDLIGHKLYNASKGAAPEFILDYVLKGEGVDPVKDVTVDYTFTHEELAQQIAAGRIDTAVLPEPFVTLALSQNPALRVAVDLQAEWAKISGTGSTYPISALVVRTALAQGHPALVDGILQAEQASTAWVVAHPAEAGALAAQYIGIPAPVVTNAMPRLNLRFVPAATARPAVDNFLEVLAGFDPGSVGGKVPDAAFYLGS
jgi:NitT/TauT family transport system substrate-binding protein